MNLLNPPLHMMMMLVMIYTLLKLLQFYLECVKVLIAKFKTAIPRGYYGQICSRSSLVKNNLITAEAGVIDSGYRGHWFFILINHGIECFNVAPGDKIAQVIFIKKETVEFVRVKRIEQIELSKRGCARFGSSGKKRKKIAFVEPSPSTSGDIDDNNDDNEITESEGLIFID